jgi:hypothetical protein
MQFVVMGFGFQVVNYVLPVGGEDVFVGAVESLVDLGFISAISTKYNRESIIVHLPRHRCRIPQRAHILEPQAVFVSK